MGIGNDRQTNQQDQRDRCRAMIQNLQTNYPQFREQLNDLIQNIDTVIRDEATYQNIVIQAYTLCGQPAPNFN